MPKNLFIVNEASDNVFLPLFETLLVFPIPILHKLGVATDCLGHVTHSLEIGSVENFPAQLSTNINKA